MSASRIKINVSQGVTNRNGVTMENMAVECPEGNEWSFIGFFSNLTFPMPGMAGCAAVSFDESRDQEAEGQCDKALPSHRIPRLRCKNAIESVSTMVKIAPIWVTSASIESTILLLILRFNQRKIRWSCC